MSASTVLASSMNVSLTRLLAHSLTRTYSLTHYMPMTMSSVKVGLAAGHVPPLACPLHASRITHHALTHDVPRITYHEPRITHPSSRIPHHASLIPHHSSLITYKRTFIT